MSDDTAQQSDREIDARVPGGRLRSWFVLEADRWSVATALAIALLAVLLAPTFLAPDLAIVAFGDGDEVDTLFQALVAGIVTGVTMVVTITQLVLSQELGAVGDQRERMRRALAFQEDIEEVVGEAVSPTQPAQFLTWLVDGIRRRAERLREAGRDERKELARWIDGFVDRLGQDSRLVSSRLEGAEFGTFQVIHAALDYNYSWKIHLCRRVRFQHGDDLDPGTLEALDGVQEALEFFGPAREHFKTLYFQWELTNLSREIIYAAVPALAVSIVAILYLDAIVAVPASLLGVEAGVWAVVGCTVVALLPFLLLLSYMLRIATVTQRTLAIGPFVLRETDRDRELVRELEAIG